MKGKRKVVRNVFKTLFDYLFEQVWNPEGSWKKIPTGGNFFSPFSYFSFDNQTMSNDICTITVRYYDTSLGMPQYVPICITPKSFLNHRLPGFDVAFNFESGVVKYRLIAQNPMKQSVFAERARKGERIMWILADPMVPPHTLSPCIPPMNWIGRITDGHYRKIKRR